MGRDRCAAQALVSSRLILGTAQFGRPYGIANRSGQVGRDGAAAILSYARSVGIDTLDTAIAYGDSEQNLGAIGVANWNVVSKLPEVPKSCNDVGAWVSESVHGSLRRLGITGLYGLLLHRSQELCGPHGDALYRALLALKDQGAVGKIGISIYAPEELDAIPSNFELDLYQAPFNVLDRRLVTSGWLLRLREAGREVHVRSAFLQGLLLMDTLQRPASFDRWRPVWNRWERWLAEHGKTSLRACLEFVLGQPGIDRVIVGVDAVEQMQQIAEIARAPSIGPPNDFASEDLELIDPSRWSKH
jgi:hypothetical protein